MEGTASDPVGLAGALHASPAATAAAASTSAPAISCARQRGSADAQGMLRSRCRRDRPPRSSARVWLVASLRHAGADGCGRRSSSRRSSPSRSRRASCRRSPSGCRDAPLVVDLTAGRAPASTAATLTHADGARQRHAHDDGLRLCAPRRLRRASSSSCPTSSRASRSRTAAIFTFHLRQGHSWSDGQPFTTEDFRYCWEDVANNKELSPDRPAARAAGRRRSRRRSRSSTRRPSATPGRSRTRTSCRRSPARRRSIIYRPGALPEAVPREIRRRRGAGRRWSPKARAAATGRRCTTAWTTCTENDNPDAADARALGADDQAAVASASSSSATPTTTASTATGQQLPYIDRVIVSTSPTAS